MDYPYFIDARDDGLNAEHPITRGLPQVTVPWAVPISIDEERNAGRQVTALISSSDASWTSPSSDVLPRMDDSGMSSWAAPGATRSELLATVISGRFDSFFAGQSSPLQESAVDGEDRITSVIERSPESARLLVIASNDFLRDDILTTISSLTGGQYLGPLELIANAIDWSLEDGGLLGIRSNAHFNRTLPPLERQTQSFWEYLNYAAALLALIILALLQNRSRRARQARYVRELGGAA